MRDTQSKLACATSERNLVDNSDAAQGNAKYWTPGAKSCSPTQVEETRRVRV